MARRSVILKKQANFPEDFSELMVTHADNYRLYSSQYTSAVNQVNTFSAYNINQQLLGFSINKNLHPIIIGTNSRISRRTVPKNELISFKLTLESLHQIAINTAVRQELKKLPLEFHVFTDGKKSMLQSSIFNAAQDLMTKILNLLPIVSSIFLTYAVNLILRI